MYHTQFDALAKINPNLEWYSIGTTLGGKHIKCYKISHSEYSSHNKMLIVGGIHGNEVGTVKLAHKIINESFKTRSNRSLELFVIPCLNLDGFEQALNNPDWAHRGKVGRFNARGVDLNRNFPTEDFQKYSEWKTGRNFSEKSQRVYCGERGASEPEIQSLINLIQKENISNLIMLHNVGKDVVIHQSDTKASEWASVYKQNSAFNVRTDLNLSGSAGNWAWEKHIHFMSVEGTSRWGSDWDKQKKSIMQIIEQF